MLNGGWPYDFWRRENFRKKKIKQTEWEQKKQLDVRLHPKIKKNNLAKTNPPPLKIKWTTLGTEIAKSRLVVVTLKEKQKPRKQELKLSRTPSLKQVYNTVVIYTPTHICIPVHINNLQSNYWLVTVPLSKAICLLTSAVFISLTSLVCGQNSLHFHSLIVHENFFSTDVHW